MRSGGVCGLGCPMTRRARPRVCKSIQTLESPSPPIWYFRNVPCLRRTPALTGLHSPRYYPGNRSTHAPAQWGVTRTLACTPTPQVCPGKKLGQLEQHASAVSCSSRHRQPALWDAHATQAFIKHGVCFLRWYASPVLAPRCRLWPPTCARSRAAWVPTAVHHVWRQSRSPKAYGHARCPSQSSVLCIRLALGAGRAATVLTRSFQ